MQSTRLVNPRELKPQLHALDYFSQQQHRIAGRGVRPELDACNGHYGTVPANASVGVDAGCVYHYHLTDDLPYTIGCYGPVASVAECKSLYGASPA
jgi:hypothetical protein